MLRHHFRGKIGLHLNEVEHQLGAIARGSQTIGHESAIKPAPIAIDILTHPIEFPFHRSISTHIALNGAIPTEIDLGVGVINHLYGEIIGGVGIVGIMSTELSASKYQFRRGTKIAIFVRPKR